MCGCGIADWCAGGCSCGCDHDTLEGQRSQAQHFARNYKDMTERATDAFRRGAIAGAAEGVKTGRSGALYDVREAITDYYKVAPKAAVPILRIIDGLSDQSDEDSHG
jgi:hypothetical protein